MLYCTLNSQNIDNNKELQIDEHHMKTELEYLLKNIDTSELDLNDLNIEQKYQKLVKLYINKLNGIEDNIWKKYNHKFRDIYFIINKRATIHLIYDKNKIELEKKRILNLSEGELFEEFLNKLLPLGKIYLLRLYIEEVNEFYQTHLIPSYYYKRISHHIDDYPQKHRELPNIDKKTLMEKIKKLRGNEDFKKFCRDFMITFADIVVTEDKTIEKKLEINQFEQNKVNLDSNKIDLAQPITTIIGLDDRIVVQNADGLYFYDCNTYSLINKMNYHFNSKIIKTNDGYIIGKNKWTNKVTFVEPKKLTLKEKYFIKSDYATITHVCSNDTIIMVNNLENSLAYEETLIYSKYKDIYVLSRIIYERFLKVYDIGPNLLMAKGVDGQYVYSINNFDYCLKFKKANYHKIITVDEHKLLAYDWKKESIDILDTKSLNVISSFNTRKFLKIKKINNKNIILSRDDGVYELIITDSNQIFENKLINNRTKNIGLFGGFGLNEMFFQLEGKEINEKSRNYDLMIKFASFNN
jgi:hypothetical protein